MKNIKSLFVLICSVALIMGSCAKKDDEETTTVVAGTGTGNTASGTISGIDYLTGTFTMSYNGQHLVAGVSTIAQQYRPRLLLYRVVH